MVFHKFIHKREAVVRAHAKPRLGEGRYKTWRNGLNDRANRAQTTRSYFDPRLRVIETAEISLPGDWIEIDC